MLLVLLVLALLLAVPGAPFPWHLRVSVVHTYRLVPASEMFGRESNEKSKYFVMMDGGTPAAVIEKRLRRDAWAMARLKGQFGVDLVEGAAGSDRLAVVRMLLSLGAPVNGTVALGRGPRPAQTSPLDTAVTFGHARITRALIGAGADPYEELSLAGGSGTTTPYHDGMESRYPQIVALMRALGPPPKISLGGNAKQLPTTTGEAGGK